MSGTAADTSFRIKRIDALHLAVGGSSYWEGYRSDAAFQTERFEFKPGWRTVYAKVLETAAVRVELSDGSVGWGEATEPICPEAVCLLAENLAAPIATGRDYANPAELWQALYDAQRGRGHVAGYYLLACAAIDVAVWDALGHREDQPVAAFFAEAPRTRIPVYLSGLRRNTLPERVALLNEWRNKGLQGAKIFLDGDYEEGLREIEGLQAGSPGLSDWMVDTLWMLPPERAHLAKKAYGDLGVKWLECPLLPEDLEGHVALTRQPGANVALGEHFFTRYQSAPWFAAKALNVFQPDVCRTGFSDGLQQMSLAEAEGILTTPHMGAGLLTTQAVALHFAALCPDTLLCEFQAGQSDRLQGAVQNAWHYTDGAFTLPDAPGLGITVDEQALRSFARPWKP